MALKKIRIGVDLGATNIKVGVIDEKDELVFFDKTPTISQRNYIEIVNDIADLCESALAKSGTCKAQCLGVGVGSPGAVNSENGVVVCANNFKDFENVPLAELLSDKLKLNVRIANDADCAALGEILIGSKKEYDSGVLITLGTGVGVGVVLHGSVFMGSGCPGVEFGHSTLVYNGESCTCGRRGCFEAYCSATALIRDTIRAADSNPTSVLAQLCTAERVSGETVFKAAALKDATAITVLNTYVEYLGAGIVNAINAYRPQVVLLSGGICDGSDYFIERLNEIVSKEAFAAHMIKPPPVKIAKLRNNAGTLGAACLVSASFL